MQTDSVLWMGNRVQLQQIDGTDLTLVQWYRPWNGVLRGVRVLDGGELQRVQVAVEQAAAGTRTHPRLEALAGQPLDLETLLAELLGDGDDLGN